MVNKSSASIFREKAWKMAQADLGLKDTAAGGKYFESSFLGFLMTYVKDYNEERAYDENAVQATYNKKDDFIRGTDLKITDTGQNLLDGFDVLRIDPTANFFRKKEMPVMTKPESDLNVNLPGTGLQIRYGLRIGNSDHAFSEPVVVMGLVREDDRNRSGITKEDVKTSVGSFWNTTVPDMLAKQIIQNAAYFRAAIDDAARGIDNSDIKGIGVNRNYVESKSRHMGRRFCNTYMVKNGEIITDSTTGDPRMQKTDVPWTSPAAHNVLAVAETLALRDGMTGEKTRNVFDRLLKDVVRDEVDPPKDLIADKIVKFYEQKDAEDSFAAAVGTISDNESIQL